METYKTEEEYQRHCHFCGELSGILYEKYPANYPWVFEYVVEHSAMDQHFTVYFRNFDGTRHLIVGVNLIAGEYRYTFSEKDNL